MRFPRGIAVALILLLGILAACAAASGGDRADQHVSGRLGVEDGVTPDDSQLPLTSGQPAVAKLDPKLLGALQRAADDARREGVEIGINSGWRSKRLQRHLFREAVQKYGSKAEASRWVATAKTSAHVAGKAVDVGPTDAMSWLQVNGWRYGLCQTYGNEMWHFERRTQPGTGCPPSYADATSDPRMNP